MVITDLSDELIAEGQVLLERLDASGVTVSAALWCRYPESDSWRLALALPAVAKEGPRHGYRLVQRVLFDNKDDISHLALSDVTVVRPDAPLIQRLRAALRKRPGISRIWFTGSAVHGEMFPDSMVYRVT